MRVFRVMTSMSARLHEPIVQIDDITLHDATYRVVTFLLTQLPAGAEHARVIQPVVQKRVIASRLSIQPETFSRLLARLRRGGLIDADGAHIVLKDVERLQRLVAAQACCSRPGLLRCEKCYRRLTRAVIRCTGSPTTTKPAILSAVTGPATNRPPRCHRRPRWPHTSTWHRPDKHEHDAHEHKQR